ncbi:hypothetical protein JCM8208_003884 [Rhodotorula glutinis]
MALKPGVDLRPPQPIPSPAHGRLVPTSSPTEPPTSTQPSGPAAAHQRPHSSFISRRPDSGAALSHAGPSSSSLVPGQPTEDDWWRFSAPKRGDAERGAPLRSTVPRQKVGLKRGEPAFKMVGEWRIGDSLGRGTGGTVRLAVSVKSGQYAAVKKVVRVPDGHKHGAHAAREISLLKLVAPHPHFIQLYNVFETPSHFFLVTEYCSLGALFDYVADHFLEPFEVQKLFLELVSALTHLNRFRIAHRDLKPENLLLCRDEHDELTLKISDMGLASFQPEDTLLKTSCGSPHYAAPEIVSGLPYDGALADVWSAGVVLYAMLAGVLPFDDDNNPALFAKIRSGVYDEHPDVPPVASDLISHCLVVDPGKRYTIVDVAAHPFLHPNPYSPGPLSLAALYPPAPALASPPSADKGLDATVLASLKIVLQADSVEEAEWLVRSNGLAQHFYSVLLGFRHPRPVAHEPSPPHFDHSSILASAFDDASSEHTRSVSAPQLVVFPLPPATVVGRASETAQTAQRERFGRAQGVLVQLRSSADGHGEPHESMAMPSSYETINRDYTFPSYLGPPPSPASSTLPLPTAHLEVPTSAPPQIESFGTRATSPSPYCLGAAMRPSVERSSTGKSSGSGGSHSLPATPTGIRIDPAFLAASRPSHDSTATAKGTASAPAPPNEERGVRPRPSMHQRLRSLFHGAGSKRTSLIKDAAPSASSSPISFELVSPQPTPSPTTGMVSPTQRQPHKLVKRQSTAFVAPRTSTPTSRQRPPSIAPSTRTSTSSHLKRSPALSNLSHALHEYHPPLSPILSPELAEFGELLALGASATCSPRLRAAEAGPRSTMAAARRSSMAMTIYQDSSPAQPSEPSKPVQPRSSSLRVPHSVGGRENAPSARVRQALDDKVSPPTSAAERVKSTWRSSMPAGGSSAVPTVKLDRIGAHHEPAPTGDVPTTSSKSRSGPRRNPSLSIEVPPRPTSLHPAHALTAPARTSTPTRRLSSSSPIPPSEYEHRLSQLRAANRALHAQLADEMAEHDDEVDALRLEVRALHDERDSHAEQVVALRTQVDELVEYASSLIEENAQLRGRLERDGSGSGSVRSRASSSMRGGGGGSSTISIYSSDGRRERVLQGEWVGARGSRFEDERDEGLVER